MGSISSHPFLLDYLLIVPRRGGHNFRLVITVAAYDISTLQIFSIAVEVIKILKKHTSDIGTAVQIMNAAKAGFDGGFSLDVRARIERDLHPSVTHEVPQESGTES